MNKQPLVCSLWAGLSLLTVPAASADHHGEKFDVVGVWKAVASSEQGEREYKVTVTKDGDGLRGTSLSMESGNERTIDRINVEGKSVTFEFDIEYQGSPGLIKVVAGAEAGEKLAGKWSVSDADGTVSMSGGWRAEKEERAPALAGDWKSFATTDEGEEYRGVLTVSGEGTSLSGQLVTDTGDEVPMTVLKQDGKGVHLEFTIDIDGTPVPGKIAAQFSDANQLVGKWSLHDGDGNTVAGGDWSGTRKMAPTFVIAGAWDVVAELPDGGEYNGTLTVHDEGGVLSGTTKGDETSARKLKSITFDGKALVYTVDFEMNSQVGLITVDATRDRDGKLAGTWTLTDSTGSRVAGDDWRAARE
jgi:hypothetical protein